MEDIEYLEEYEDAVLSHTNMSSPDERSAVITRVNDDVISITDSSSSLDPEFFNFLFGEHSDDDNVTETKLEINEEEEESTIVHAGACVTYTSADKSLDPFVDLIPVSSNVTTDDEPIKITTQILSKENAIQQDVTENPIVSQINFSKVSYDSCQINYNISSSQYVNNEEPLITVITPEKVINEKPLTDPLNFNDDTLPSGASNSLSLSDTSGHTVINFNNFGISKVTNKSRAAQLTTAPLAISLSSSLVQKKYNGAILPSASKNDSILPTTYDRNFTKIESDQNKSILQKQIIKFNYKCQSKCELHKIIFNELQQGQHNDQVTCPSNVLSILNNEVDKNSFKKVIVQRIEQPKPLILNSNRIIEFKQRHEQSFETKTTKRDNLEEFGRSNELRKKVSVEVSQRLISQEHYRKQLQKNSRTSHLEEKKTEELSEVKNNKPQSNVLQNNIYLKSEKLDKTLNNNQVKSRIPKESIKNTYQLTSSNETQNILKENKCKTNANIAEDKMRNIDSNQSHKIEDASNVIENQMLKAQMVNQELGEVIKSRKLTNKLDYAISNSNNINSNVVFDVKVDLNKETKRTTEDVANVLKSKNNVDNKEKKAESATILNRCNESLTKSDVQNRSHCTYNKNGANTEQFAGTVSTTTIQKSETFKLLHNVKSGKKQKKKLKSPNLKSSTNDKIIKKLVSTEKSPKNKNDQNLFTESAEAINRNNLDKKSHHALKQESDTSVSSISMSEISEDLNEFIGFDDTITNVTYKMDQDKDDLHSPRKDCKLSSEKKCAEMNNCRSSSRSSRSHENRSSSKKHNTPLKDQLEESLAKDKNESEIKLFSTKVVNLESTNIEQLKNSSGDILPTKKMIPTVVISKLAMKTLKKKVTEKLLIKGKTFPFKEADKDVIKQTKENSTNCRMKSPRALKETEEILELEFVKQDEDLKENKPDSISTNCFFNSNKNVLGASLLKHDVKLKKTEITESKTRPDISKSLDQYDLKQDTSKPFEETPDGIFKKNPKKEKSKTLNVIPAIENLIDAKHIHEEKTEITATQQKEIKECTSNNYSINMHDVGIRKSKQDGNKQQLVCSKVKKNSTYTFEEIMDETSIEDLLSSKAPRQIYESKSITSIRRTLRKRSGQFSVTENEPDKKKFKNPVALPSIKKIAKQSDSIEQPCITHKETEQRITQVRTLRNSQLRQINQREEKSTLNNGEILNVATLISEENINQQTSKHSLKILQKEEFKKNTNTQIGKLDKNDKLNKTIKVKTKVNSNTISFNEYNQTLKSIDQETTITSTTAKDVSKLSENKVERQFEETVLKKSGMKIKVAQPAVYGKILENSKAEITLQKKITTNRSSNNKLEIYNYHFDEITTRNLLETPKYKRRRSEVEILKTFWPKDMKENSTELSKKRQSILRNSSGQLVNDRFKVFDKVLDKNQDNKPSDNDRIMHNIEIINRNKMSNSHKNEDHLLNDTKIAIVNVQRLNVQSDNENNKSVHIGKNSNEKLSQSEVSRNIPKNFNCGKCRILLSRSFISKYLKLQKGNHFTLSRGQQLKTHEVSIKGNGAVSKAIRASTESVAGTMDLLQKYNLRNNSVNISGIVTPQENALARNLLQKGVFSSSLPIPLTSGVRTKETSDIPAFAQLDNVFKKIDRRYDNLVFGDRHRIMESVLATFKFQSKDVDMIISLLEKYNTQMDLLINLKSTPSANSVSTIRATTMDNAQASIVTKDILSPFKRNEIEDGNKNGSGNNNNFEHNICRTRADRQTKRRAQEIPNILRTAKSTVKKQ